MRKVLLRPVMIGVWGPKWGPKGGIFEHFRPSVLVVRASDKNAEISNSEV